MTHKSSKGFTLIELLIVITIIGILAAAFLPSVLNAPAKARDATRITTLGNIAGALELYASDNAGYPDSDSGSTCLPAALTDYFPGKVQPKDPSGGHTNMGCAGGYFYCKSSEAGINYILAAGLEEKGSKSANAYLANTEAKLSTCVKSDFPATGGTLNTYYLVK